QGKAKEPDQGKANAIKAQTNKRRAGKTKSPEAHRRRQTGKAPDRQKNQIFIAAAPDTASTQQHLYPSYRVQRVS
ncbi:MAG TPA: hypothetical protein VHV99_06090, partial [Paraburkholderia sp.]|nr:hypothetical protein [Paraburkholderia sp.]